MASLLVVGDVLTSDPAVPRVGAVGIIDGRVVALGSPAEVREQLPPATPHVRLGTTMVPGFVDSHVHAIWVGRAAARVALNDVTSIGELQDRIRLFAATRPDQEWIEADAGFDPTGLAEGRLPTAAELDAAAPGRPVLLDRKGHDGIASTAALRLAGIDASTPDPAGGHIERDPAGEPTGLLVEHPAVALVRAVVPGPDEDTLVGWIEQGSRVLRGHGFTSVVDPAVDLAALRAYAAAARAGRLPLRTVVMPLGDDTIDDAALDEAVLAAGIAEAAPGLLHRGPTKLFLDGGGSLGTAWLSHPWPGTDGYTGNRTLSVDALRAHCRAAAAAGRGVGVHAVGDAAIDLVLEVLGDVHRTVPVAGLGFHLIHAYLGPSREAMARARRLGVAVSAHPALQWQAGAVLADRLGEVAAAAANPLRAWLDAGVLVGGGSDGPGPPLSALHGMWQARTRMVRGRATALGPEQAVTAQEALTLFTTGAARVAGLPGGGRLHVGGQADLAVLDVDPLGDAAALRDGKVLATVVRGEVHEHQAP